MSDAVIIISGNSVPVFVGSSSSPGVVGSYLIGGLPNLADGTVIYISNGLKVGETAPGSGVLAYRSGGKWYRCSDDFDLTPYPALFALPVDQSLFINGVSSSIRTAVPAVVTADGVSIGSTAGVPPTLAYTPAALDADQTLATPVDSRKIAVVPADNSDMMNVARYASGGNVTITGGQPGLKGASNAIDIVCAVSATSQQHYYTISMQNTPAGNSNGLEIVFRYLTPSESIIPQLMFYTGPWAKIMLKPGGLFDTHGSKAVIRLVETFVDGGFTWYRVFIDTGGLSPLNEFGGLIYGGMSSLMSDSYNGAAVVNSANHGIRIGSARSFPGLAPLYKRDRAMIYDDGAVVGATPIKRLRWTGQFNDGTVLYDQQQTFDLDVYQPTTFNINRSAKYRWILLPPVEVGQNVYNGELTGNGASGNGTNQGVYHRGLADTYDIIFVRPNWEQLSYGGKKNDGTHDHLTFLGEFLPRVMRERFNCSSNPLDVGGVGYSKAAESLLRLRQAYPDVYGFIGIHDGPYDKPYNSNVGGYALANFGEVEAFGDQATYDAWNPYTHLAERKSAFTDRKRISLSYQTFGSDYAKLKTRLDANGITYKDNGSIGVTHDFLALWADVLIADVVAMMNGTLT